MAQDREKKGETRGREKQKEKKRGRKKEEKEEVRKMRKMIEKSAQNILGVCVQIASLILQNRRNLAYFNFLLA